MLRLENQDVRLSNWVLGSLGFNDLDLSSFLGGNNLEDDDLRGSGLGNKN